MKREFYIGVDVSKNWLDLAYYDGVVVDWKQGHIRVDNKESGYSQIGRWLKKLGVDRESVLFCMEHTGLYSQDFPYLAGARGLCVRDGAAAQDAPFRA